MLTIFEILDLKKYNLQFNNELQAIHLHQYLNLLMQQYATIWLTS